MATTVKAGFSCRIEVNATGVSGGTWVNVILARDVTVNLEQAEIDVSSRGGSGWVERIPGLKDASIDLEILDDTTAANGYAIIKDAATTGVAIGVRAINGASIGSGNEALVMLAHVVNFTRNEPLNDVVTWNVRLVAARSADAPAWVTSV